MFGTGDILAVGGLLAGVVVMLRLSTKGDELSWPVVVAVALVGVLLQYVLTTAFGEPAAISALRHSPMAREALVVAQSVALAEPYRLVGVGLVVAMVVLVGFAAVPTGHDGPARAAPIIPSG